MALVDDQGRILGRFNLLDLALAIVFIGLIPLGYGAYALFKVPLPKLTSIEPATLQLDREMRIVVHGENLRPYMRISIADNQTRGFLFKDITSAEVAFSDIPPGVYDVVLYDFAQERARLPKALTITQPALPITEVFAAGFLTGVSERLMPLLKPGFSFQGLAQIVEAGAPGPDLARIVSGDRTVEIPVEKTVKIPMLLRIPCTVQTNAMGTGECHAASANGPGVFLGPPLGPGIYVSFPILDVRLPFLINQVRPPTVPVMIEVRVRVPPFEDAGGLAKSGDTDVGVAENPFAAGATVIAPLHGEREVTLRVPAFPTSKGWDYSGQTLRVGATFWFTTTRYQMQSTVSAIPPLPSATPKP